MKRFKLFVVRDFSRRPVYCYSHSGKRDDDIY